MYTQYFQIEFNDTIKGIQYGTYSKYPLMKTNDHVLPAACDPPAALNCCPEDHITHLQADKDETIPVLSSEQQKLAGNWAQDQKKKKYKQWRHGVWLQAGRWSPKPLRCKKYLVRKFTVRYKTCTPSFIKKESRGGDGVHGHLKLK